MLRSRLRGRGEREREREREREQGRGERKDFSKSLPLPSFPLYIRSLSVFVKQKQGGKVETERERGLKN